ISIAPAPSNNAPQKIAPRGLNRCSNAFSVRNRLLALGSGLVRTSRAAGALPIELVPALFDLLVPVLIARRGRLIAHHPQYLCHLQQHLRFFGFQGLDMPERLHGLAEFIALIVNVSNLKQGLGVVRPCPQNFLECVQSFIGPTEIVSASADSIERSIIVRVLGEALAVNLVRLVDSFQLSI